MTDLLDKDLFKTTLLKMLKEQNNNVEKSRKLCRNTMEISIKRKKTLKETKKKF